MNRLTYWILHEAWIVALELALVAALAISLAYWTWVAISPATVAAPLLSSGQLADRPEQLASRNLFGVASTGVAAGPRSASVGLKVLGIFSGEQPGAGRAILAQQGGRPRTVSPGEAIADGLTLHEVHPDHVIILRNGVPERVDLERRVSNLVVPAKAAPAQVRR